MPAVRAFCESRGEDVWLRESGMLMVSASPSQDDAVDRAVAAAAEVGGEQAVPLDADGVAGRIRSPVFRRGVYFPDGATVQPARLVHALRRAAVDAGVELYEHTAALSHFHTCRAGRDALRQRSCPGDRRRRQCG